MGEHLPVGGATPASGAPNLPSVDTFATLIGLGTMESRDSVLHAYEQAVAEIHRLREPEPLPDPEAPTHCKHGVDLRHFVCGGCAVETLPDPEAPESLPAKDELAPGPLRIQRLREALKRAYLGCESVEERDARDAMLRSLGWVSWREVTAPDPASSDLGAGWILPPGATLDGRPLHQSPVSPPGEHDEKHEGASFTERLTEDRGMPLAEQVARLAPHLLRAALRVASGNHAVAERVASNAARRLVEGHALHGDALFRMTDEDLARELDEELADAVVYRAEQLAREAGA